MNLEKAAELECERRCFIYRDGQETAPRLAANYRGRGYVDLPVRLLRKDSRLEIDRAYFEQEKVDKEAVPAD